MSEIKLFSSHAPQEGYPIQELGMYSDGTPLVKQKIPSHVDSIVVQPHTFHSFVTAMFLVDSLNEQDYWIKNLILPYVPGARQDRINPTGDILFTMKSVARMINDRNFSRVVVLDPHSSVAPALINRCSIFPLANVAKKMWQGYGGVIAPDAGASKRAEEVAAVLGVNVTQASKHRDVSTGRLSGFEVKVTPGVHYLVVDDICDGGGTFVGLGEKIKAQGAFADLYVTHPIFSKGTSVLKEYYKNIFTTDSRYPTNMSGLNTLRVVYEMMELS